MKTDTLVLTASLLLVLLGIFLPFWPLFLLAVLLLGIFRKFLLAVSLGVLLDLLWGAPPGSLSFLLFPITLFAAGVSLAAHAGQRYLLEKSPLSL